MNIENIFILEALKTKVLNHVGDIHFEGGFLTFKLEDIKGRRSKVNLVKNLWGPIQEVYDAYIFAELFKLGYIIVPLDNGWICVGTDNKEYQMTEHTCSCEDFLYGQKEKHRCKHLIMRDAWLNYRTRIVEYKNNVR